MFFKDVDRSATKNDIKSALLTIATDNGEILSKSKADTLADKFKRGEYDPMLARFIQYTDNTGEEASTNVDAARMTAAAVLEDSHELWQSDAVATIIGLAHVLPQFSADDLAKEMRPAPHPNSPGQAFSAARAKGHITAIGYQQSTTPSRKNGVVRVWRLNTGVAK